MDLLAGRQGALQRIADGDREAWGLVYEAYAGFVYARARAILSSHEDAEDLVQEVFLALPRALQVYESRGRFESWLSTVTLRTAFRLRPSRTKEAKAITILARMAAPGGRDPEHPERALDRIELDRLIAELPNHERSVVLLRLLDVPDAEIAEALGVKQSTIRSRRSRALKRLRGKLRS